MQHRKIIIGVMVGLVLLTPAWYFYQKYHTLEVMLKNPQATRKSGLKNVINQVAKHIQLPKNETPELVTVSNKDRVRELAFFKNAENGDKVLLYKNAKMAYLYRPRIDQLINAAPIIDPIRDAQTKAASPPAQNTTSAPLKVVVYNGTTITGYGREIGDKIVNAYPDATIVSIANASEQKYKKTIVIDLSGKNRATAQTIAEAIGASVTQLPPMEARPEADILVIAGK